MNDITPEAVYLIRKGGAWYRHNSAGYTISAIQAGRYTRECAEEITHPNGPDGPRDNMSFIHEDDLDDLDWAAYKTLSARVVELEAAKWHVQHTDTMNEAVGLHMANDELIARVAELEAASAWQPIETAPRNVDVLLYCPDMGCPTNRERIELGMASSGWSTAEVSTISHHSWATKWQPLPKTCDTLPHTHTPSDMA
ncbi:MAG: hypothetical protein COA96_10310 [SAR86 cluster bacterium]|uniref:Uncharacterized protein n=1 Tax=SAR86 cluster bacterium TaxID=2030880 RepID=A0A2A5AXY8_9GAMM|nr:MAG: hypothetical protein COA96_10310 [SAR86 cluster bacterium]